MIYRFMYKYKSLRQKMLTSLVFLLAGAFLLTLPGSIKSPYCLLIFAGLAFSFAGDWTLRIKVKGIPGLIGIICFAAAHLSYIAAYLVKFRPDKTLLLLLPFWAGLMVFEIIAAKKLKIDFSGAGAAVAIYCAIIDAMVLLGIRTGIIMTATGGLPAAGVGIALLAGVVSFMLSDCGVCMQMFTEKTHFTLGSKSFSIDNFSIVTYFGGQLLIAASMLF